MGLRGSWAGSGSCVGWEEECEVGLMGWSGIED